VTRVAAVDCGTNSIRLLVADVDTAGGTLRDVDRRMTVVRLGEGVDRTGRLSDAALHRTSAALRIYADRIEELGAGHVRMVATSATRDAENRGEFVRIVHDILGVDPDVVTGDDEARLSFTGATKELGTSDGPYLVVDIGGGSTEFVLGSSDVLAARSVDIGCVRMTERHLHDDPPTANQLEAARADVDAAIALAAETVPLGEARVLVGVAGTVTTVAAMALDLPTYDEGRIHLARIDADAVHDVTMRLLAMPRTQRAALPYMHPGRVDVIGAGALILDEVVRATGAAQVVASEHDILDGLAWSLAEAATA
jgi:exopolyphosphatase/guanosine-5'-triphosphate,3'-diphosphate pyrophosphatase